MSGFDTGWLGLREAVDRKARNADILAEFVFSVSGNEPILDIGCGTGSTYRAVGPALRQKHVWALADHDPGLLAEARRLHGAEDSVRFLECDLNDLSSLPISKGSVLTASALFDLCSDAFVTAFAAHLAEYRAHLYAALNYDGRMSWTHPHRLDGDVVSAFNRHQRTDKGFGPALGSGATARLQGLFEAGGYRVRSGPSPWIMTGENNLLQRAFIDGVVQAVAETGTISESELHSWRDFRIEAISLPGSSCEVGHQDLLAWHSDGL